jgi:hypothetical protein
MKMTDFTAHFRPLAYAGALYQLASDRVMRGSAAQPTRVESPSGRLLKVRSDIWPEPPNKPWQTPLPQ